MFFCENTQASQKILRMPEHAELKPSNEITPRAQTSDAAQALPRNISLVDGGQSNHHLANIN